MSIGIAKGVLLVGFLSVLVVGVIEAQHDPNAENTRFRPTGPVNGKGGQAISGPYEVVLDWPQPLPGHEAWHTGRGAAVHAESPDRVYVALTGEIPADYQGPRAWGPTTIPTLYPVTSALTREKGRWEHSIMVLDRNGRLLESWEQWNSVIQGIQRMVLNPNDPEHHVWIPGVGVFTRDGKEMVVSFRTDCEAGTRPCVAAQGSHLDWLPNGDFFIASNTSVVKWSKDWKKLAEFGRAGSGPLEFNGIHGLVVDATRDRIYISDRGNSRIQILDLNGNLLDTWPNLVAPYCIRLTADGQYLWVTDGFAHNFSKYEAMTGKLLTTWGTFGSVPGTLWGPHDFDTDSEGNLYIAEDYNARVQKFRPMKDTNFPEQLIGQLKPGGR